MLSNDDILYSNAIICRYSIYKFKATYRNNNVTVWARIVHAILIHLCLIKN